MRAAIGLPARTLRGALTVKRPAHDGVATVTAAAGVPATEATIVRANPEHPHATRWRTVAVPVAPIVTRRSACPDSDSVACVPGAPATLAPIQPVSSVVVVSPTGGTCACACAATPSAAARTMAASRRRRGIAAA